MPRGRASNGNGLQPRQRKDGRWEARFKVGTNPGTGKPVYKTVYGRTADECARKLRAAVAAIDEHVYMEPSKMPLKEWLQIWLTEYTLGVKPGTLKTYETQIRVHIAPSLGALRLSEIRAHDIQTFVNRLHKGYNGVSPVSAKTVKNNFGILHRALEQAVRIGYLRANPASGCVLPRVERKELQAFDDDDSARFLNALKGHRNERFFLCDLFTGMRKSELLGLTWDCVDFEAGTIRLYRQLLYLNGKYFFGSLKNDKARVLSPSKFVMNVLREQRKAQIEQRMKAGYLWQNKAGFVFTDENGEHLRHSAVYKQFKALAKQIGLPEARFHDMRHSYAVAALRNGDDVKTVQESLGHATASFTLDQYGHVTPQMKRESAARMDAHIESLLRNKSSV